jgi:hypothetical protein
MIFDVALIETNNGGDVNIKGNDLAVISSVENMIYLALFGGNVEESTKPRQVNLESFDWWGNTLLMSGTPSQQFNSETERTLRDRGALTSKGRTIIESAVKEDLKFFAELGIKIRVEVSIVSDDYIKIEIWAVQKKNDERVVTIDYKKTTDGDFFLMDFNDDFLV